MRAASSAPRFKRYWHSLRDERASNVAQAAAVAILATALIGSMLLISPSLRSGVDQSFSCLVSVLGGSGAGCQDGGAAQQAAAQQAGAENREQYDEDCGFFCSIGNFFSDVGDFLGGALDIIQIGLDILGLIPGLGEIADGINGLISLARGDYVGAALSFAGMIPFAGWGATGSKWIYKGTKYADEIAEVAKYGDEAAGITKYGDEAADAAKYGDEAAAGGKKANDMDPVCTSSAPIGKVPGLAKPAAAPGCYKPGSPEHRQQRWEEYQERGGEWSRERWDKQYDVNMNQARRANERVDAYHQQVGWGKREVTVPGTDRRLDIGDIANQRGIEHKTGYITRSPDINYEVSRDAQLVKQGWDIKWVFETNQRPSKYLLDDLEKNGIPYEIITPP